MPNLVAKNITKIDTEHYQLSFVQPIFLFSLNFFAPLNGLSLLFRTQVILFTPQDPDRRGRRSGDQVKSKENMNFFPLFILLFFRRKKDDWRQPVSIKKYLIIPSFFIKDTLIHDFPNSKSFFYYFSDRDYMKNETY